MIDEKIFKAYDIRGIYPMQINPDIAYRIACAYASFLKNETGHDSLTIVVSSDMRESSPALKEQVLQGLIDSGVDVIDVGLASTPSFYFYVAYNNYDGGIQISASHNPKEYNGFKMVRHSAIPISGETGLQDIKNLALSKNYTLSKEKGIISSVIDIEKQMFEIQAQSIDFSEIKPLKIVVDTANAMGILDVKEIFSHLNCEVIYLNDTLDGTFPAHDADPLKDENMKQLQDAVIEHEADLGIASDGDGDRYFFVDNKGRTIRSEILRGVIGQLMLKKNPGAKIAYDIRPGKITQDLIEQSGGVPIVTRVGHSLIKEQMLKEGAVYGGESSGHYYFAFNYGTFESSVVLLLELLMFISKEEKTVAQIFEAFNVYSHSGEINQNVQDKDYIIKKIASHYSDAKEILWIDGVSIVYEDFWFNVRASNTEPVLRLNLEAIDDNTMKKRRDEVLGIMTS